jgi:predicted RNA-binding protein with PIN domain
MPLLIDGHNLIGRMVDISMAEPADEAELVRRVRQYCWRQRRRATIVFDAGLPGGRSDLLSTPQVEVVFASSGGSADDVICGRLRRSRDPRGLRVVSSDRAVQMAAAQRGAQVVAAEDFARELETLDPESPAGDGRPVPWGSPEEWLRLLEGGE